MIALLPLMMQATPVLTEIGRQSLPTRGCAAFLWQGEPSPRLVAMVGADQMRIGIDGRTVTLPRTGARGEVRLGLPASADFAGNGWSATVDMAIAPQSDLADGARVRQATLSITRDGGDLVVVPSAGLVGCAATAR